MDVKSLFDLSGRTALVTGGSRGIGRFLAEGLAEAGAHVLISSRKADACEAAAAELRDQGGRATALPADVCERYQIDVVPIEVVVDGQGHPETDLDRDTFYRLLNDGRPRSNSAWCRLAWGGQ